jgi:hypothetical protein
MNPAAVDPPVAIAHPTTAPHGAVVVSGWLAYRAGTRSVRALVSPA